MTLANTQGPDLEDFVRLHITPFDARLLDLVVPNPILPLARNISYHSVETFPEKRFGFLDLPPTEAEKLKKKLNGATLRGVKMKIEKARTEDWIDREKDARDAERDERKKSKRKVKAETEEESFAPKAKRRRDPDVVEGVVLKDRKVKRGWTETPAEAREKKKTKKDKSSKDDAKKGKLRTKSKHTENPECLLKVQLPPNAVQNLYAEAAEKLKRRKKKRGRENEVAVHEFENMTGYPGFLKSSAVSEGHTAAEYVEGRGWVNAKGEVIEAAKSSKRPLVKTSKETKKQKRIPAEPEDEDDDTSSSGTSSSGSDSTSDEESEDAPQMTCGAKADVEDSSEPSSSGSGAEEIQPTAPPSKVTRPSSSSSTRPLSITIPPPPGTPTAVHPLEALYKRKPGTGEDEEAAAAAAASKNEPFSFFGGGNDSDFEDVQQTPNPKRVAPPMTPYTKQDFEWRNIRSAAPTPDTAHPSRMKDFFSENNPDDDAFAPISEYQDEEEVEEEEEYEEDEAEAEEAAYDHNPAAENEAGGTKSGATPSGDFQSWFWENRRDLNRTWMQRRKAASKEKRHRENRARASRAV